MNDKFYIRKFIRSDGEVLSFDGEEILLDEDNTLLVRPDPETTAVSFTEASGGEMINQKNPPFEQEVNGLIVPKTTPYWELVFRLTKFFKINFTYKIIYAQKNGGLFTASNAWISSGLQVPPQPREEYAKWSIALTIGDEYWREYSEDSGGNETYANTVELSLSSGAQGGEKWDGVGAVWNNLAYETATLSGVTISIPDAAAMAPASIEALGNTAQNGTPTPDSPVPIQTVTGRQVVSVNGAEFEVNLGKNLFNASDSSGKFFGYISWNGQAGGTSYLRAGSNDCCYIIPCKPNTTYALQKAVDPTISANRFRIANAHEVPTKDITLYNTVGTGGGTEDSTIIYTTDSEAKYIVFYCWYYSGSLTANEMAESIQVEKGDTVTDYASYFTPIELCKIGNYQDRIYKDGERWYLEKQTGEAMLAEYKESAERNGTNTSGNYRFRLTVPGVAPAASISTIVPAYCSHLAAGTAGNTWDRISCIALDVGADGYVWLYTDETKTYSVDNFKTWLEENSPAYYYPLATPTTTEITNDSLIEQLNQLKGNTLTAGENEIEVSSADLAAPLEITYYTDAEQGAGGEVWELGAGGAQDVTVDSTTTIYPIWEVSGECVNPTLRDNTTDTVAKYNGTVASGQTLTVDFETGVAYLNNALVTRNVEGLVKCTPGVNTMGFSSDGGSTSTSKIKWNNVIG